MSGSDLRQRLAAILAADVAGYSRLMSLDERATVAALDAARAVFRSTIESNQGRVIDMAGDSVLAAFETAAGAVGAALAVQKALDDALSALPEERRMRFRIGIHLGDVIEKSDGTVYGDGVNIAARLEALAEPGGVAVSNAVEAALRNRIAVRFEDRGEHGVKNMAHPVHAFALRADRPSGPSARPRVLAPAVTAGKPTIAVLAFENMSA
ncbi:MAG: adenylate/guanylate cyclase domain-containing protein, partial [Betaproteobacteria bacterium]|nr:adenylate/guanylate cyclase domain-containing protein [Betaproteobacteria bacterium]